MSKSTLTEPLASTSEHSQVFIWLKRLVNVEPEEIKALLWSFSYFFALLCSYYIVRPIRDEMAIAGDTRNLPWLFTGTFLVMLAAAPFFGWVTSRYPRKQFIPYIYGFFIFSLLLFFTLFVSDFTHAYVARAFFIWASVFNLFIISVFWSFMADIFNNAQAKRLFGFIAAGGTIGALAGPALTASLVLITEPANLLLLSAALLGWAIVSVRRLIAWKEQMESTQDEWTSQHSNGRTDSTGDHVMGGSILAGIRLILTSPYLMGICFMLILLTTLATFLYYEQAEIMEASFSDSSERTAIFASIDFTVNTLTLILQVFFTGRIVNKLGVGWLLAVVPLGLGVGFLILGFAPLLGVIIVVQVLRRAGNYAIMRPGREMLFVVVGKEEKYKAKNVIDTAVYRGGDAVSAWAYAGLQAIGMGHSGIAFVAVPLAGLWVWISLKLGRKQEALAEESG